MKVSVLFGQRTDPDSVPEALEAVDSFTEDENPEIKDRLFKKHDESRSFKALAWFDLALPAGALAAIQMRLTGTPSLKVDSIEPSV